MSADEIRRLAGKLKPEEGCFVCNHEVLKPVHAALLAYAAMVERCEKEYAQIQKRIKEWPKHGKEPVYAHQIQWCLERIRGDALKEAK